jgi:2-polyprenyl-3-methyl-5-hydroxy-6-metoxy-1,4-benzoquinol methylase
MNYAEQQEYLSDSHTWAAGLAAALLTLATVCLRASGNPSRFAVITAGLIVAALAISLSYTPDYLHVTSNPEKGARWGIRIRWRILGAALVLGLFSASNTRDIVVVLLAIIWFVCANRLARIVAPRHAATYFWLTDVGMLAILLLVRGTPLLLGAALLAAAAHLSIVICQKRCFEWAAVVTAASAVLLFFSSRRLGVNLTLLLATIGLVATSAVATALLVWRAQKHSARNVSTAIAELVDFTGYSEEKVRELWLTSNQQLAANWEKAHLAEDDAEQMAEWYRENSELYLFAISAYNLEFKRIRSNLGVLKYASGACLDYGAGNGELLLELARQGHSVTYYDVEGKTMQFARRRAHQRGLTMEFARTKDDLVASTKKRSFDTVFSFDVLEHLPDLPGELGFLSSLLVPGGRMMFDVPAGSTKAHPMHLNHNLDVRAFLLARGMEEERSLSESIPFKKQEKYVFRAKA